MPKANAAIKLAPKPPSGAKRRNRKVDVTDAAIDVFWRKGYSAASVQDVADSVGVLKGSLYYYIDSKEDLLYEILHGVHEEALARIEAAIGAETATLDK